MPISTGLRGPPFRCCLALTGMFTSACTQPLPQLRWTFTINLILRNTKLWAPVKQNVTHWKGIAFFFHQKTYITKIILSCYILNYISKIFMEICFLSCYISIYIISLILPRNQQSLKYLLCGSSQKKFMWSVYINHSNTAVLKNCLKKASNETVCTIFYYTYSCTVKD